MTQSGLSGAGLVNRPAPLIMGILNVTPDSFSDGGRFVAVESALTRVEQMIQEGADIIDVGGESTRPNALPVSVGDELRRVIPVIETIRSRFSIPVSVDTSKPDVMREAVRAGANAINDVYALRAPGALEMAADLEVPVCLMHMQGEPRTMQKDPHYDDVVSDVKSFLLSRVDACLQAGVARDRIWIDPGFGFGKTLAHNLSLLKHLDRFVETGFPVLAGISRKSMLGQILDADVDDRLFGSVAAATLAARAGARIIRVHDVRATAHAIKVCHAVQSAQ